MIEVLAGVIGLCAGSFVNVVIARVPAKESVVRPRSHCRACGGGVAAADLIPVLSWIRLRGRCRACGERISPRYPVVELLTAGLFVALAFRFGAAWELPAYGAFVAGLVALSVIDLDHLLLPNRVLYPTLFTCAALLAGAAAASGGWTDLRRAAIGGFGGFVALLVIHLIYPRGMAFGDVRLAGLIGMMLGWLGVRVVILGLFLGFVLASVVGVGLMVTRRRGRKDEVPFGPFLAAGAIVAVLFGPALLAGYGR